MANLEKDITMSESADTRLSRRNFLKLGGSSMVAAASLALVDTAPAWAKAAVRGAEQGVLVEEHQRIINSELPGVKTEAILLDLKSGTGVHQIMEEETPTGRIIYTRGQSGRRIGVIPGSGRQTVAVETLVTETDGERIEVGMRLPESTGNDRYTTAVAAQFVDSLDKGIDNALGIDLPLEKFAVALRTPKGTPVVHLGEHSLMRVEPEADPNLVLKPIDLAMIIQRSGSGAAYILKVGDREVKVENAQVIRDESLVSAGELSGVVITANMLPTPAPVENPQVIKADGGKDLNIRLSNWREGKLKVDTREVFTLMGSRAPLGLLADRLAPENDISRKASVVQGVVLGTEIVDGHLIGYFGHETGQTYGSSANVKFVAAYDLGPDKGYVEFTVDPRRDMAPLGEGLKGEHPAQAALKEELDKRVGQPAEQVIMSNLDLVGKYPPDKFPELQWMVPELTTGMKLAEKLLAAKNGNIAKMSDYAGFNNDVNTINGLAFVSSITVGK